MIGLGLAKDLRKEIGGLSGRGDILGVLTIVGLFFLLPVSIGFYQSRQRRQRRAQFLSAQAQLERLQRDQTAAERRQYVSTSCPVCLEDFPPQAIHEIERVRSETQGGTRTPVRTPSTSLHDGFQSPPSAMLHPDPHAPGPSAPPRPDSPTDAPDLSAAASPAMTYRAKRALSLQSLPGPEPEGRPPADATDDARAPLLGPEAQRGDLDMSRPMEQRGAKYGPIYLPCGHAFCGRCLAQWMDSQPVSNPTCPVCRQPIVPPHGGAGGGGGDGRGAPPPPPPRGPRRRWGFDDDHWARRQWFHDHFSPYPQNGGCGMGMDAFGPELLFRLRQLQRRYPIAIDPHAQQRWTEAAASGRTMNAVEDVQNALQRFDETERLRLQRSQEARNTSSGGGGSSSWGFKGGSSGGGGGRGGGW